MSLPRPQAPPPSAPWYRRARPLLGTLVEVGLRLAPDGLEAVDAGHTGHSGHSGHAEQACQAAFQAIEDVQRALSRFDAASDLSRFHALRPGHALPVRPATQVVLAAARRLQQLSDGAFDISLGTGPAAWRCEDGHLVKLAAGVHLDVGGIAKGHAVDLAVDTLVSRGCRAGWVNAGGDLRAFGDIDVPVQVRDERTGGVRDFAALRDGAFATSCFDEDSRSRLAVAQAGAALPARRHVSVAAPLCLWADALTKVVAVRGRMADPTPDPTADPVLDPLLAPLLARFQAMAWIH